MCVSYQCLDWTAGSVSNTKRQAAFKARTGNDVIFGVGSYGDNTTRAGFCYRIKVSNVARDLIVQVVNQGSDVPDGNFDMMIADGGFGLFDACADGAQPQYATTPSVWGDVYGGVPNINFCKNLPQYPICQFNPPEDNLQQLCVWSFQSGLRTIPSPLLDPNTNPKILKMCQVACPSELYTATGLHRADEPRDSYSCDNAKLELAGGRLTRMMDCGTPLLLLLDFSIHC
jgi:hypothetical protein